MTIDELADANEALDAFQDARSRAQAQSQE
jgi:hypothetical protein